MKIQPEDKDKLFDLMDARIKELGVEHIRQHRSRKLGNDVEKRFRWDLLYMTKIRIGDGVGIEGDINLYSYLNDDHIDTALKDYVANRPALSAEYGATDQREKTPQHKAMEDALLQELQLSTEGLKFELMGMDDIKDDGPKFHMCDINPGSLHDVINEIQGGLKAGELSMVLVPRRQDPRSHLMENIAFTSMLEQERVKQAGRESIRQAMRHVNTEPAHKSIFSEIGIKEKMEEFYRAFPELRPTEEDIMRIKQDAQYEHQRVLDETGRSLESIGVPKGSISLDYDSPLGYHAMIDTSKLRLVPHEARKELYDRGFTVTLTQRVRTDICHICGYDLEPGHPHPACIIEETDRKKQEKERNA